MLLACRGWGPEPHEREERAAAAVSAFGTAAKAKLTNPCHVGSQGQGATGSEEGPVEKARGEGLTQNPLTEMLRCKGDSNDFLRSV